MGRPCVVCHGSYCDKQRRDAPDILCKKSSAGKWHVDPDYELWCGACEGGTICEPECRRNDCNILNNPRLCKKDSDTGKWHISPDYELQCGGCENPCLTS